MKKDTGLARTCSLCGRRFQLTPDYDEGRFVACYQIFACCACWDSHAAGWGPDYEALLRGHLEKNNEPVPERLSNGLFPRE